LIQFIQDPNNDSYEVRNELMLVAPSVTTAAWEEVFERIPAMNPWHIAQALIANSPLQKVVLLMLPEYDFHPYYVALVEDAQNEGTSMHDIYLSEISHFESSHSRALSDLTRNALRSADTTAVINARTWHEEHPVSSSTEALVAICYALGDTERVRQIVDAELIASPYRDYWEVHDLYLTLLENNEGPMDLGYSDQMSLLPLALSHDHGSGEAQAWLTFLGGSFDDHVVLPTHNQQRRLSLRSATQSRRRFSSMSIPIRAMVLWWL